MVKDKSASPRPRPQDVQQQHATDEDLKKTRPPHPLLKDNDDDDEDVDNDEIASSKMHAMDYVIRTEVIRALRLPRESDWYLFMLKEKFDNAIDFLWKHYPDAPSESKIVLADVTLDYNNKLFHCVVSNSNDSNKPVFRNLNRILDFNMTYGTKQNDFVISRGTLGDALKRLSSIPYTLMKEDLGAAGTATGTEQWTHPAFFRFNNQEFKSVLEVDDMNSTIKAPPVPTGRRIPKPQTVIEHTWHIPDKVRDLDVDNGLNYLTANKIEDYCRKYLIFTTDISFVVLTSDSEGAETVIKLPATLSPKQTTSLKKWINISSIFYYTLEEFTRLLYSIDDKNKVTVYQLANKRFREWNQVSKKEVPDLDIALYEFLKDPNTRAKNILSLYLRLRTEGKITTPPDRLSLPYTHKQERKIALVNRINDAVVRDLDTGPSNAAYEILHGVVRCVDNASGGQLVQYPYAVEVVAIPFFEEEVRKYPDSFKSEYIAGAINYSYSPGELNTFPGSYRPFNKKKNKVYENASNIINVFEAYGFDFSEYGTNTQDTKMPCVIAVNLISPKLAYTSEGKSNIDVTPFHQTIEEAVEKVANRIPTFRRSGIATEDLINADRYARAKAQARQYKRQMEQEAKLRRQEEREQKKLEREYEEAAKRKEQEEKAKFKNIYQIVEQILLERINEYHANGYNPEIFAKRRKTQDGIWYLALPQLELNKIVADDAARKNVKKYIKPICKKYNVRREDIGIIAGARAAMYYNGEFKMVSFFEVAKLARNGTDVVYIEKMGMVEAFKDFADQYRIALVNSQGQLTDYAKELADLALESGGHVFIMTDYDVPGIIIASKLGPNIPWIGINKETIEYFDIPLPSLPDPDGSSVKKYPVGEPRHVVVPYDVKAKPKDKEKLRRLVEHGENELEDEDGNQMIVKDLRFSPDKVDLDWLWTHEKPTTTKSGRKGISVEGHKIEIDAVVKDQESEKVWQYIIEQIAKYQPNRDYTRVIPSYIYTQTPNPPGLPGSISVSSTSIQIVSKLQSYLKERAEQITEQPKQEIQEELKDYEGFIHDVPAKEDEISRELNDVVDEDEIMNDVDKAVDNAIEQVCNELSVQPALDTAAAKANEAIIKALRKLDAEKEYGIMKALGMEEGSQN